jgi:hypothetical protein
MDNVPSPSNIEVRFVCIGASQASITGHYPFVDKTIRSTDVLVRGYFFPSMNALRQGSNHAGETDTEAGKLQVLVPEALLNVVESRQFHDPAVGSKVLIGFGLLPM